jgi:hypothetical protein
VYKSKPRSTQRMERGLKLMRLERETDYGWNFSGTPCAIASCSASLA